MNFDKILAIIGAFLAGMPPPPLIAFPRPTTEKNKYVNECIDIETKVGREKCRDEMYRTLKPGGYALATVCSIDDEWEKELIANYPGPEVNSTIWPQNGKFQKDYDEAELREFYKMFDVVELQTISKPGFKLGRNGTVTNLWAVLRKTAK